jgi:hypothetical protein
VVFNSEHLPNQLFGAINLPSLTTFNYSGGHLHTLPFDSTVAFLNRSGCILKSFSLKHTIIVEEMIIRLLFAMPYLETLTLGPHSSNSGPYVTDRMLNMLADTTEISARVNDQPDIPFLPKLQSLQYRGWPGTFSRKCIPIVFGRRTIHARQSARSNRRPLRSFKMDLYGVFHLDLEPNTIAELKLLTAEGYEIQILSVVDGDLLRGCFV